MNTRPLPTEADILAAVAALQPNATALLQELVRHPSLLGQEASAQDCMAGLFAGMGLRVDRFEIDEERLKQHPGYAPSIISYAGRPNVVGVHDPKGPTQGKSLILNGHIDVVPVGWEPMWSTPPFEPRVQGTRLYGRGSNDMKAGIVAYTMAFKALQNLGVEPAAKVMLQSVIEEECTGNGALACLVQGYTADAALIPEPTHEEVMCSQMGVLWLTLDVTGVPVHAAQAYTGVDAIGFTQYLVDALRELQAHWNLPANRHALYCRHEHPINFNLGLLQGGEWGSSVPTHCRARVRVGYYPGRQAAEVRAELEAHIAQAQARHAQAASVSVKVSYQGFQSDGVVIDLEQPSMQLLMSCHEEVMKQACQSVALTATTDVRCFQLFGHIPATCYGPMGGSGHGIDEWVCLESLQRVTAVYALFIARWCGLNRVG